jgi:hypothetical protein
MAQPRSPLDPEAVFQSTLLDASGQPNLIIDSTQPQELIWTLVNNATDSGQDLVVKPFTSGSVGPDQYHFQFGFAPGALTEPPTLQGWDVAAQKRRQWRDHVPLPRPFREHVTQHFARA